MNDQMDYRLVAKELPAQLLELMGEVARLEREWDRLQALVDQKDATGDAEYARFQALRADYQALQADHQELKTESRFQQLEIDRLTAENVSLMRTVRELGQEVELLRDLLKPGQGLLDQLENWSAVGLADHFDAAVGGAVYHRDAWLKLRDACCRVVEQHYEKEAA